ncbi:MAG: MBL fold metallo-hydrolase [Gammaproteobacteria bacterium]|nr:MAG: MBL fold metallo-hydrolase [Gammaproteobacteria bacterium]
MNNPTIRASLAILLMILLPALAVAQDEVRITTQRVAGNIHMLQGQGGNIGLFIGPEATFLVDDQFAPLTEKILAAVKAAGGKAPDFLLNTHYHGDHTGGNENLGKGGTLILSHDNVRERLVAGSFIAAFKMKAPPQSGAALPVVTFNDEMTLHINGETVRTFHVAHAHTDGDSVVQFVNANVIHTGDLFFNGFYPFIDVQHGGSLRGMIDGVDRILALANDDTRIIPGHGPLGSRADLIAYRDMLATALQRLRALKDEGMTAAEAVAAKPLADLEAEWGDGFLAGDTWIGVVYPGVY